MFKYISIKVGDNSTDPFFLMDSNFKRIDEIQKKGGESVSLDQLLKHQHFLEEVCQQGENNIANVYKNEKVGDAFSEFLKKKYRLNVIKWEPNKNDYPRFMLLGTDKGILAYVEPFYHHSLEIVEDETYYEYGISYEINDLIRKVSLTYSDLDRPTFYIHFVDYPYLKGIYFETTEQIIDCLFGERNPVISLNDRKYYFSSISEMGEFEELIEIFYDLKKNNVQFN